ncbi:hypothetical protein [Streptomyces sp. NPDC048202]|uniref:hypothetical protein n=1 Tax=Streptomyces sp. NPDC048202 TaxID=3365514 RepID=UPI00371D0FAF
MGLNMVVGVLVDAKDDDYTKMVRADFVTIGELLEGVELDRGLSPTWTTVRPRSSRRGATRACTPFAVSPFTSQQRAACPSRWARVDGRPTTRS